MKKNVFFLDSDAFLVSLFSNTLKTRFMHRLKEKIGREAVEMVKDCSKLPLCREPSLSGTGIGEFDFVICYL